MCVYLCSSFYDWLWLSLLSCTDSWLRLKFWSNNWNDLHSPETDSHSSWVTASRPWSPGWRGCGPGWTEWFCPCTVAVECWFLPALSGLPLTEERDVRHTPFHFSLPKRSTLIRPIYRPDDSKAFVCFFGTIVRARICFTHLYGTYTIMFLLLHKLLLMLLFVINAAFCLNNSYKGESIINIVANPLSS